MSKYKFKIPIGDWSDDGHGKCDYYIIESNLPVEQVRELHYKIKEVTGININDICSGYGDCTIDLDTRLKLEKLDFYWFDASDINEEGLIYPTSEDMANLWMFLLQKVDSTLEYEFVDEEIPMLPFYGCDKQRRHISFVGYGLFE